MYKRCGLEGPIIKQLLLSIALALVVFGCEKLDANSRYNIGSENLAAVSIPTFDSFGEGRARVSAEVINTGLNDVLRYGFLLSPTANSFGFLEDGVLLREFDEAVEITPKRFSTEISNSELSYEKIFVGAYVVNESGIAYSPQAIELRPILKLASIDVLSDTNDNGRVNPGEVVELRFNVINQSPLIATEVVARSINDISGFITTITPNQNVALTPLELNPNSFSSFRATFRIASNANADIPITVRLMDSVGRQTDLKNTDGSSLEIEVY